MCSEFGAWYGPLGDCHTRGLGLAHGERGTGCLVGSSCGLGWCWGVWRATYGPPELLQRGLRDRQAEGLGPLWGCGLTPSHGAEVPGLQLHVCSQLGPGGQSWQERKGTYIHIGWPLGPEGG